MRKSFSLDLTKFNQRTKNEVFFKCNNIANKVDWPFNMIGKKLKLTKNIELLKKLSCSITKQYFDILYCVKVYYNSKNLFL